MDFKQWVNVEARIKSLIESIIAEDKGEGFLSWFRRRHPIKPDKNTDCTEKVKEAIQTLRDSLKGSEFDSLLDELESKLKGSDEDQLEPEVNVDFGFEPDFTNFEHTENQMSLSFREYFTRRLAEDAAVNSTMDANQASQVVNTNDPKEKAKRKAVGELAGTMMKKNTQLRPGATDQRVVANAVSSDPQTQGADPDVQRGVADYFLKAR
jgi:hypothetical protein